MDDLWLFVVWNRGQTWTRALIPVGVRTPRELVDYLRHGGEVDPYKLELPPHARFVPRVIGMTVLAQLVE